MAGVTGLSFTSSYILSTEILVLKTNVPFFVWNPPPITARVDYQVCVCVCVCVHSHQPNSKMFHLWCELSRNARSFCNVEAGNILHFVLFFCFLVVFFFFWKGWCLELCSLCAAPLYPGPHISLRHCKLRFRNVLFWARQTPCSSPRHSHHPTFTRGNSSSSSVFGYGCAVCVLVIKKNQFNPAVSFTERNRQIFHIVVFHVCF